MTPTIRTTGSKSTVVGSGRAQLLKAASLTLTQSQCCLGSVHAPTTSARAAQPEPDQGGQRIGLEDVADTAQAAQHMRAHLGEVGVFVGDDGCGDEERR